MNAEIRRLKSKTTSSAVLEALPTVRSLYDNQVEILNAIERLHCPEGFECDMTYGNGSFWKNRKQPRLCFDLTSELASRVAGHSFAPVTG